MTDLMIRALEYAKNDKFYDVLECAKKMNPPEYMEFFEIIGNFKENPDFLDKMGEELSFEDMSEFLNLGSSKRMAQYLVDKAENTELSEDEMNELKSAVL